MPLSLVDDLLPAGLEWNRPPSGAGTATQPIRRVGGVKPLQWYQEARRCLSYSESR
jgi:uncharacterized protein YfaS (alpha-2-macroglobulin family)